MRRFQPKYASGLKAGVIAVLSLAGCASAPRPWIRADGAALTGADLQLAVTACKGEVAKAAVQGQAISTIDSPFGPDRQDRRIYEGCMAQRGLIAAQ